RGQLVSLSHFVFSVSSVVNLLSIKTQPMSSQKQQPAKTSKLDQLRERQKQAEAGGGEARVEKQHSAGKMTARERVEFLLDAETFQEFDKLVEHRSRDFGLEGEIHSEGG